MTARFTMPEDALDRMRGLVDSAYVEEKFHAKIAEHAGETFEPTGFVLMWTLAISDYVDRVRGGNALLAIMEVASHQYARKLIDDEDTLAEVLDLMAQIGLYDPERQG